MSHVAAVLLLVLCQLVAWRQQRLAVTWFGIFVIC
jgi:hypothetical protein